MSTRGFIGFVIDGIEKITYNHSDSYPEWLGVRVLEWIRSADIEAATAAARALRVVDGDSEPTDEDIERLRRYLNDGVDAYTLDGRRRTRPSWYQLLRETQGDLAAILDAGVIIDGSDFPADSLFAEWGYLINLDRRTLEVYRGFQERPHDLGRFANRRGRGGMYPCALVATGLLTSIPSDEDFVARLTDDRSDSGALS